MWDEKQKNILISKFKLIPEGSSKLVVQLFISCIKKHSTKAGKVGHLENEQKVLKPNKEILTISDDFSSKYFAAEDEEWKPYQSGRRKTS